MRSHSSFVGTPPLKTNPNASLISMIVVEVGILGITQLQMADDRHSSFEIIPFKWVFSLSSPKPSLCCIFIWDHIAKKLLPWFLEHPLFDHVQHFTQTVIVCPSVWWLYCLHSPSLSAPLGTCWSLTTASTSHLPLVYQWLRIAWCWNPSSWCDIVSHFSNPRIKWFCVGCMYSMFMWGP